MHNKYNVNVNSNKYDKYIKKRQGRIFLSNNDYDNKCDNVNTWSVNEETGIGTGTGIEVKAEAETKDDDDDDTKKLIIVYNIWIFLKIISQQWIPNSLKI